MRRKGFRKALHIHLDGDLYNKVVEIATRDGIPVVYAIHVLLSAALRHDLDVVSDTNVE